MTCIEVIIFILLSAAIVFFFTFAVYLVIEMIQSLKYDFILPLFSEKEIDQNNNNKTREKIKKMFN